MKIFGKYGLGNILKIVLQLSFVFGILILIIFPMIIAHTNISLNPNVILFYPNAICLLLIIYQFIGLFNSLKENNPFCVNTVKRLKRSQNICAIASLFWIFDFVFETFIVKNTSVLVIIVLIFMCILFIGVTIALYLLAELFKKAMEYKNENELTI